MANQTPLRAAIEAYINLKRAEIVSLREDDGSPLACMDALSIEHDIEPLIAALAKPDAPQRPSVRLVTDPESACRSCSTLTHCKAVGRCLAECEPSDIAQPDAGEGCVMCGKQVCVGATMEIGPFCREHWEPIKAKAVEVQRLNDAVDAEEAGQATPATPADTPLADPPNLRLFTKEGVFYLYGMDASGSGPTPQAAMRDWTRHRNTEAAETWPIEPADTPPPSPQPSREEWIALEAACDDSRRQRNQDAAEFWLALAAKCRAYADPETGEK